MIRIGVLSPHVAEGAEVEFPLMAPGRIHTAVSRIGAVRSGDEPLAALRARATHEAVDEAVSAFAPGSVDVLAYASTSSAYVLGYDAETRLVEHVSERWAVPVCSTGRSAVEALRSLHVERLALVHPPWFGSVLSDSGTGYFRGQGFSVVESSLAGVPDDPGLVTAGMVVDWISQHVDDDAEAVFIGGNGFRAARAVSELEDELGRPVLASNQVLLWSILARAGVPPAIGGFGALLE